MKQTPNQLFKQLSKEFSPKKDKELINEELGQIVTLKPINTIEASPKDPFWTKFENFLAEGGTLDPIVNDDMKTNTLEKESIFSTPSEILYEPANLLSISYFNLGSAFTFSSFSKVLVFIIMTTIQK